MVFDESGVRRCCAVAQELFDKLHNHPNLQKSDIIFPGSCIGHCFRIGIKIPGDRDTVHLSVSVPPDTMGNRISDLAEGQEPSTYETALFLNDSLRSPFTKGFHSIDDLVDEILRLHTHHLPSERRVH